MAALRERHQIGRVRDETSDQSVAQRLVAVESNRSRGDIWQDSRVRLHRGR